jgi:glycosyltransferase involved in cell wall biosynthesis
MVQGVPSVVSNAGGLSELVTHNETGLIIQECTSKKLSRCLLDLEANETLSRRLGAAGKRHIKSKLGITTTIEKTGNLYKRTLNIW